MTTLAAQPRLAKPARRATTLTQLIGWSIPIGALLALALYFSPIAAAVIYVPIFLSIGMSRPEVCLALIIAASPFQQDLGGEGSPVKFSLAEVNLALTMVLMVVRNISMRKPIRLGPLFVLVLLFLLACVLSSIAEFRNKDAVISFGQRTLYLVGAVTVFASFPDRPSDLTLGLHAYICSSLVLALGMFFTSSPYLWGLHKNGIGGSLSSAVVIAIDLWIAATDRKKRRILFIALVCLVVGLVWTRSRGAWLCALVGVMAILALRGRAKLAFKLSLFLIPVIVAAWFLMSPEERDMATRFSANDHNIEARLLVIDEARTQFEKSPLTGVGLGFAKEIDATNLFWITLAETGILGLGAFALLHLGVLVLSWRVRRKMQPNHPLFSIVVISTGLVFGRFAHGMVDHYWSRGNIMVVWASVGMLSGAYYATRVKRKRVAARRPMTGQLMGSVAPR